MRIYRPKEILKFYNTLTTIPNTIHMNNQYKERLAALAAAQDQLIQTRNESIPLGNGVYDKYQHPILTAAHVPLNWRYDLHAESNPFLMERIGVNAVFNAGAIKWKDSFVVVARVEGVDRKSFFAIAESANGVDGFRFWDKPIQLPQTDVPDTNVYDMRLVAHEDGWIYGLFCTERRDPQAPDADQSAAIAQCGIVRTKDLVNWERLPDLKSNSAQQRNVVLHPEFVDGKYALYTRPQDSFIEAGKGGGIAIAYANNMENAEVDEEHIISPKMYHTVYESKNGQGPAPIKTRIGWIHLAHGVRNTAAGLRYVLYVFVTDLKDITKVIHKPGGFFMAPNGEERVGDVSNVVFANGWIQDKEQVYIYYASSDTRLHVATTTVEKLIDYAVNTPEDGLTSAASVQTILDLIAHNHG